MAKSIIGKSYIPNDNSYCVNLTYPGRDHRLAGTMGNEEPKVTKILTEPYQFLIRSDIHRDTGVKHWFIQVDYEGDVVRVLYQAQNVNADLDERIATSAEHKRMYAHGM